MQDCTAAGVCAHDHPRLPDHDWDGRDHRHGRSTGTGGTGGAPAGDCSVCTKADACCAALDPNANCVSAATCAASTGPTQTGIGDRHLPGRAERGGRTADRARGLQVAASASRTIDSVAVSPATESTFVVPGLGKSRIARSGTLPTRLGRGSWHHDQRGISAHGAPGSEAKLIGRSRRTVRGPRGNRALPGAGGRRERCKLGRP